MGCEQYHLDENRKCKGGALNGKRCVKEDCPYGLWDGADNLAGYLAERESMIPGPEAAR